MSDHNNDDDKPLTFFQLLGSAFAAFIGIQTQENRERDFKKMKPHHFIITGLLLMAIFFSTVMIIIKSILLTSS